MSCLLVEDNKIEAITSQVPDYIDLSRLIHLQLITLEHGSLAIDRSGKKERKQKICYFLEGGNRETKA